MSLPLSPPWPRFGGLIAPPLPSPSSRIGGCPSARSPLGMGVRTRFACVWDSGERESAETGTGSLRGHAGTRSARHFPLLFASSLWPEADTHSLSSAPLVQGSRAPLGPSLCRRRDSTPTRGCSSPSPSSLLLNSRSISYVFHLSSALCPSPHQPWGNIAATDRVVWWLHNIPSPDGETEAGRDFRGRTGLHWEHRRLHLSEDQAPPGTYSCAKQWLLHPILM